MQRRTILLGLGSLAVAGTTAVSTGAFTSVRADRTVAVEVAGDSSGFLGFHKAADTNSDPGANSDAYVEMDGGTVAFDFSSSNGTANLGEGFNMNAVTEIDDLIAVKNNGTQSVYLSVDLAGMGFIDSGGNNPYVGLAVKSDQHATSYANENIVFNSEVDNSWGGAVPDPRLDGPYELAQGESVNLDLTVDTSAVTAPIGLPNGTLAFIADQESTL